MEYSPIWLHKDPRVLRHMARKKEGGLYVYIYLGLYVSILMSEALGLGGFIIFWGFLMEVFFGTCGQLVRRNSA